MGITANCAKFLLYAKTRGVDFSGTLMLGRQQLFLSKLERAILDKEFDKALHLPKSGDFAEELFRALGATTVESMDYSDFERATIIHNLNEQVPQAQLNKYSTVFDGGTLEHVFNFPKAIKNCMDMLKIGGHFVSITPTNNQSGHGFYQFSPELFFSLFTDAHGFKLKLVAMGVELPSKGITEWFEVKDPKSVGGRVIITNSYPTSLLIIAEKIKATDDISLNPFQSDYHHIWDVHNAISNDVQVEGEGKWVHWYRRWTPGFIKKIIRRLRNSSNKQSYVKDLGFVNPLFFTKMDV
jgi:hypothetical protein